MNNMVGTRSPEEQEIFDDLIQRNSEMIVLLKQADEFGSFTPQWHERAQRLFYRPIHECVHPEGCTNCSWCGLGIVK